MKRYLLIGWIFLIGRVPATAQRVDKLIDQGWKTVYAADSVLPASQSGGEWRTVELPHNWDDYAGYRRLRHGNLHGYAWYYRTLKISPKQGRRYFLYFEGVGSYAVVWVNGHRAGGHAGGRTSFTLDITNALESGVNSIQVRADHPAFIRDLPWVCGGCSDDRGFSEGSQPLGVFRPVHLVETGLVRVEPFGVHVWNDTTVSERQASVYIETEVKNYDAKERDGILEQRLMDRDGHVAGRISAAVKLAAGGMVIVKQQLTGIARPHLWSVEHPYLYRLVTILRVNGMVDSVNTEYGIRRIHWVSRDGSGPHPFLLNGQPVFINGIAEYEHKLGSSHAFTAEEIRSRAAQIRAAGFNAFRDAHQPHNLLYQHFWDSLGILWWPQLSAHIWYDSPDFRRNFKQALVEWVKERRNSPSVILWGLQNESKLPPDFARECTALIRQLDPTAIDQRLVTTCNGGEGTDWNVPQNWTGTYGGDPAAYAGDLLRQVLVGEYGAWRSLGLHGDTANSEDRIDHLMELKIRLADSVKDDVAGHFAWLYNSHDNPGRVQSGEGWRGLDRIGPVNYKGLLTSWEEPLDVYYLYRSNFVPASKGAMVYIVSHTWPDRWVSPGIKNGIEVYSNCDSVELFNGRRSLGKRGRGGIGTHFQFDNVDIQTNALTAIGYVAGKAAARDDIRLNHLPQGERIPVDDQRLSDRKVSVDKESKDEKQWHYLYRVNCGGPDYQDHEGNFWSGDRPFSEKGRWGSYSWTADYPGLPAAFASQRTTSDWIEGTKDPALYSNFRYGLDKIGYTFPVQDGDYRIELYFVEPWLGTGGGMDCGGWRKFDILVNDRVVLPGLDIWKEAGHDRALTKVVMAHVTGGVLRLSFHAAAGEALISAVAIATMDGKAVAAPGPRSLIRTISNGRVWRSWLNTGDTVYSGERWTYRVLPPELYGAEWLKGAEKNGACSFTLNADADVYVTEPITGFDGTKMIVADERDSSRLYRRRLPAGAAVRVDSGLVFLMPADKLEPAYDTKPVTTYKKPVVSGDTTTWNIEVNLGDTYSLTVKYRVAAAAKGRLVIRMADGVLIREELVDIAATLPAKWNYLSTTTGTMINAGKYTIQLITPRQEGARIEELQVQ